MGSECVDSCPVGFEPDDDFSKCIRKSSLEILKEGLSQSNFVPFPYLILFFLFSIAVTLSKF
jgi:hypothetical protein